MPLQQGRDLHIDVPLSNYVVGRRPPGYIADQLVPVLNVSKRSNIFYRRNYKENIIWQPGLTAMAEGTKAREVFFSVSSDTYYAKKFGLGTYWVTEDEVNADEVIQFDRDSAELVTDRLLIDYEMRIAALAGVSTNVFTTTHVATAWSNATGSRPFDDLVDQIEAFRVQNMLKPNVAVIPEQVMAKLRKNDQIRDLLFGDRGGVVQNEQIASLLGIAKVLTPETVVNTAGPAETFAGSGNSTAAWGNKVILAYTSPQPGRMVDTWVQAYRWTNPALGVPFGIRRHAYDTKRMRQDIDGIYYQSEKVISPELAFVVDSVI
jgi:hypothetical protein